MDENDRKKFVDYMGGLAENFSAQYTAKGLNLRFEALQGYTIEQIKAASVHLLRTRPYTTMPPVADFVKAIEGTVEDRGEIQAATVLRAIRQCGRYGRPQFQDPVTDHLVTHRFGWTALCNRNESEQGFFVKEFKTAYAACKNLSGTGLLEGPAQFRQLAQSTVKRIGEGD